MFRIVFIALFFICFTANGQYNAFPKLENLYNNAQYDKCIEKATDELADKDNNRELYPYVWQMKSYLAIDALDNHTLKKNALTKALAIAIKIQKKDKEQKLDDITASDFNIIIERQLNAAAQLCKTNIEKATEIYNKLQELKPLNSIKYKKYTCFKTKYNSGVDVLLKEIVVSNYQQYKSKDKLFENMDYAYAELMQAYYQINKIRLADEVEEKAKLVYPKSMACQNARLQYLEQSMLDVSSNSSETEILEKIKLYQHYDSAMNTIKLKENINTLNGFLFTKYVLNEAENSTKIKQSALLYFNFFGLKKTDSLNNVLKTILMQNNVNKEKIFAVWINTHQSLKNQNKPIDAVKDIHLYFIAQKLYDTDFEFLQYSKTKYASNKIELQTMSNTLNVLISKQISDPKNTNTELVNKYAETIGSKEIKNKQYEQYFTLLTQLLTAKNYSAFSVNCTKALSYFPNDIKILALKKQYIIEDYKANYTNSIKEDYAAYFQTPPQADKCKAGVVNTAGNEIVINTINYVRRLAAIPDSCVLDETLNTKCQKAALMMTANGDLNHNPPKTWKCFTAEGYTAASSSNLSLGHAFNDAIMGQMQDYGTDNFSCGHRRWILNPFNYTFGHGSTMNATSLWVFGSGLNKRKIYFDTKQPVMWPSADYFPVDLIAARWSFSLSGANFQNAKITVLENGKPIKTTTEKLQQGYGLNTLVWYFENYAQANKTYTISITNIEIDEGYDYTNNKQKIKLLAYTYKVMPIVIE